MTIYIDYDLSSTILVSTIIDAVRAVLVDVDVPYRWSDADLVGFLNAGEREIVKNKPNAFTAVTLLQLAAGTRQAVPTNVVTILDMPRNMGLDGVTVGAAPKRIAKAVIDVMVPAWHMADAAAAVKYFIRDDDDQKHFYVFPPQPATPAYVELLGSCYPPEITVDNIDTATSNLDNIYVNSLIDYILYRAFQVDTQAGSPARSIAHYNMFAQGVGLKMLAERKQPAVRQAPAEEGAGQ